MYVRRPDLAVYTCSNHAVCSNNFLTEQQPPELYNTVFFELRQSNLVNEQGVAIIYIESGLFQGWIRKEEDAEAIRQSLSSFVSC